MINRLLKYFRLKAHNKRVSEGYFCQSNMNIEYIGLNNE